MSIQEELLREQVNNLIDELKKAEAQVERLTKAGDALADFLGPCWAVRKWNAAKEGKQP